VIDLTAEHHETIRALAKAGDDGLVLGDGIDLGVALHFGALGLVAITNTKETPQRAVATKQARALAYRSTFA
jgi:hypothetical protein